jgi:hypothetical protein
MVGRAKRQFTLSLKIVNLKKFKILTLCRAIAILKLQYFLTGEAFNASLDLANKGNVQYYSFEKKTLLPATYFLHNHPYFALLSLVFSPPVPNFPLS